MTAKPLGQTTAQDEYCPSCSPHVVPVWSPPGGNGALAPQHVLLDCSGALSIVRSKLPRLSDVSRSATWKKTVANWRRRKAPAAPRLDPQGAEGSEQGAG